LGVFCGVLFLGIGLSDVEGIFLFVGVEEGFRHRDDSSLDGRFVLFFSRCWLGGDGALFRFLFLVDRWSSLTCR